MEADASREAPAAKKVGNTYIRSGVKKQGNDRKNPCFQRRYVGSEKEYNRSISCLGEKTGLSIHLARLGIIDCYWYWIDQEVHTACCCRIELNKG